MDVLAHGLWGGAIFGRKSRWQWRGAFLLGVAPDVIAFGPFFITRLGDQAWREFPPYVHQLYNVTHSLAVWAVFAAAVWYFRRSFPWILGAWGLHALCDIPLHELYFFPTPYLWPIPTPFVDGIRWAQPWVMFSNYLALIVAYTLLFAQQRRRARTAAPAANALIESDPQ